MFDFRYHALSLAAVLMALLIGLLLGVAIGDEGLVSSAEDRLRDDIRGDVREARAEAAGLREELERRRAYEEATYPTLVAERLDGAQITLLFLDERQEGVFTGVRDAITPAGAELGFVAQLRRPLDVEGLAEDAAGSGYAQMGDDLDLVERLGRRLGVQFVQDGRLLRAVRGSLLASSSGELEGSDGVVVFRSGAEAPGDAEERERDDRFVDGLLAGIGSFGTAVVGVEETSTDPSQVPWYQEHGLASVDSIDLTAGRAALVFALAGDAGGSYGVKETRDALLPDELVRSP